MHGMHFRCCRICRTENNLKFSTQQLQENLKLQRKNNGQKLLLATTPTLGNICHSCEEQLQNYHQLDSGEESDVDDGDSGTATLSGGGRAESPIIVDDNELLYDLFFQKAEKRRSNARKKKEKRTARQSDVHIELTQHSLGSDGDTEIIEVLTSRESTPAPTPLSSQLAERKAGQKIVAVIDLELEEEHQCTNLKSTSNADDDEEIIFRCVETETTTIDNTRKSTKRFKKKTYAESELRLIASLSLVSSDSEEDGFAPAQEALTRHTAPSTNMLQKCKSCNVRLPDAESMLVHERIHTGVMCPVCHMGFTNSQRLVYHMRLKHRSYDGDALNERPRCAQDSAMTIRLRYLQRYTYYECQLCGRIDAVFKEHKQHVLQSHAAESKSLKDPMMKELKCPVCNEACGMQNLLLCRHLLSTHTAAEYRSHLKEVIDLRACGWSASRQRGLVLTSRVYQLPKHKNYFFECKQCSKVMANYLHHIQHLNTHERPRAPEQKLPKSSIDGMQPRSRVPKGEQKTKANKLKAKTLKKPAEHEVQQIQQAERNKKRLRKLKNKKAQQAAMTKVKVKRPLRHFPTQKYMCRHCRLVCKGFHVMNLHTLTAHADIEYPACRQIFATEIQQRLQEHTYHKHRPCLPKRKRSTKANSDISTTSDENCNTEWKRTRIAVNVRQELPPQLNNEKWTTCTWLNDLLQLNKQRTCTANSGTTRADDAMEISNFNVAQAQCCYCTHLFSTATELDAHEQVHLAQQEHQSFRRHALQAHQHTKHTHFSLL